MLREQKLLSSLTPEEQSFPRLLDRFMDDEYTILYLNDPAFEKFSESDIYAPYCTAEASDTNEFLSQGSLWIDDKLCFYPISPNRHNLLRYGKLQFFRFINGYSNMNEQQQKSTCIGTIIFTIDSMTESCPNWVRTGVVSLVLIELSLHNYSREIITNSLERVHRNNKHLDFLDDVKYKWHNYCNERCVSLDWENILIESYACLFDQTSAQTKVFKTISKRIEPVQKLIEARTKRN